jgi:cobalamin biosynthesis protein CobT
MISLLLVMILVLSLAGCGKTAPDTQQYVFEVEENEATAETGQNVDSSGVQTDTGQNTAGTQSDGAGGTAESEQNALGSDGALGDSNQNSDSGDGQTTSGTGASTNDGQGSGAYEQAAGSDQGGSDALQTAAQTEPLLDEDGSYTTKDDVALYIHTYGKLPGNFITKKQAKKLGWDGGALEKYAPGKCIGGDYFGNYEGLLPEDKEYHECDIDTLGKKRGAKRIIYSDDGYIYYTDDHYETFELLYEP